MSKFLTYIAVEDEPSLVLVRKILTSTERFSIVCEFPRTGFGYLKKKMKDFNTLAKSYVVVVVTDIDNKEINPAEFKMKWLDIPKNSGLIFELAIVEIESWILADTESFRTYFSTTNNELSATDEIPDPKRKLTELARESRDRDIREAIIPKSGAKIGPEYNITLVDYIENHWDSSVARNRSSSLDHFLTVIEEFEDPQAVLLCDE